MNPFGKWAPLVSALGTLVGFIFFGHKARQLWRARKHKQLLTRRRPPASQDKKPGA